MERKPKRERTTREQLAAVDRLVRSGAFIRPSCRKVCEGAGYAPGKPLDACEERLRAAYDRKKKAGKLPPVALGVRGLGDEMRIFRRRITIGDLSGKSEEEQIQAEKELILDRVAAMVQDGVEFPHGSLSASMSNLLMRSRALFGPDNPAFHEMRKLMMDITEQLERLDRS